MHATASSTASERPRTRREDDEAAIRMAEVFIKNERRGYPTTLEDLETEGFNTTDIVMHTPAARRIARESMADRDIAASPVEYDRPARVEKGARLMADLIGANDGMIFAKIRESGFPTKELGQLYPDMIARASVLLATQRAEAN